MKSLHDIVIGPRKDPTKPGAIRHLQLIAFLAWVGLGADGLSSACYGPEEAYLELGEHHFLSIPLAAIIIATIAIISISYAQIIRLFPAGGGGYIVASKLIGPRAGLVSGCALVVDYVLTISISIASGIDQIASFLPPWAGHLKLWFAAFMLCVLVILNLRGVKESIVFLLPIFLVFLATHAVLLVSVFVQHGGKLPGMMNALGEEFRPASTAGGLGMIGVVAILLKAFSRGAGTFTGLEAVSNSMQILREPRVKTGRRTMFLMASSLAITASGILIGYTLVAAKPEPHQTLNAVLFREITHSWPGGGALVVITLLAEGLLLFVAAQTGFIDGPRCLATMAYDSWVPKRFAHLSSRLVVSDGVIMMALGALLFLLATKGDVRVLVILYSINVFITFCLSLLGMCGHWQHERRFGRKWFGPFCLNAGGFLICAVILMTMVWTKFTHGGWVTILVTAGLIGVCVMTRRHYAFVGRQIRSLNQSLMAGKEAIHATSCPIVDKKKPTAVICVSGFNGLGLHAIYTLHRLYPEHYKNFIVISVGQVDYDRFRSEQEIAHLAKSVQSSLMEYQTYVCALGGAFQARSAVGADIVGELESICRQILDDFPNAVFFGGQLVFGAEYPWSPLLHGYVTYELQRRLHTAAVPMMILPTRVG